MILSRTSLVGLAVGATAGLSLVAFILYRECNRRGRRNRSSRTAKVFGWDCWNRTPWYQTQDADLQQVLPSVEAVVQGLSPAQQLELRNQLDQVRNFVSTLRLEVAELSRGLQNIATQIIQDVRKGVGENHRGPRWPHLVHREQEDSSGSSSSNLTASRAVASTFTKKINRCYSAYADSNSDNESDGEDLETEADTDVQMQQGMMAIQTDDIETERKPQVTWLGVERKLEMVLEDVGLPCSSSQVIDNQPQMQKEQTSPARVLRMLVKDPKADTSLLLAHSRAARLWDKNSN